MDKLKDTDLREALRRREARREQTEVPADFVDNILGQTVNRHPGRTAQTVWGLLAVAASIAVLVLIAWPEAPVVQPGEMPKIVRQPQALRPTALSITSEAHERSVRSPRAQRPKPTKTASEAVGHSADGTPPQNATVTDSLEYYISKVEQQLANIRDSCYEARVERLIRVDDRLGRLVNQLILDGILSDTLRATVFSEQTKNDIRL